MVEQKKTYSKDIYCHSKKKTYSKDIYYHSKTRNINTDYTNQKKLSSIRTTIYRYSRASTQCKKHGLPEDHKKSKARTGIFCLVSQVTIFQLKQIKCHFHEKYMNTCSEINMLNVDSIIYIYNNIMLVIILSKQNCKRNEYKLFSLLLFMRITTSQLIEIR